jgi:DNA-binding transcriptional LysR family regulator
VIIAADSQSLNEAARKLYISQPSLSGAIHELEAETGVEIFRRSSKGISLTPEGEEFLVYARQITDQYHLMEERFIRQTNIKKRFSVSMQHYTFAVRAFIELVRQYGMDEYEFAVYETKTAEVIENVKNFKSELGVIYESEFNRRVLEKILRENGLEFHELFPCSVYAYLWKDHPLGGREKICMEELEEYPCLAFDQGANISFYLSEEMFSTYDYKRVIRASDRATMLNLMIGLNGYTLCSGIICEELNGSDYVAVPLETNEKMVIGYIARKGMSISPLGERYLDEIRKYQSYIL